MSVDSLRLENADLKNRLWIAESSLEASKQFLAEQVEQNPVLTFYVTFGADHEAVAEWIDRHGWLEVEAENMDAARAMTFGFLGAKWAFIYPTKPSSPLSTSGCVAHLNADGLWVKK